MAIVIEKADLQKDKETLKSILLRNRARYDSDASFDARFNWLYLQNPHGLATAWKVVDTRTNEAVGLTSAFPRKMSVDSRDLIAWNCADFSIDQKYRSLGVALKLRRAAKNAVEGGDVSFLYAHPNAKMLVIHQKVGHKEVGCIKRYSLLVYPKKVLSSLLKSKTLAAVASVFIGPFLKFLAPGPGTGQGDLQIVMQKCTEFGPEFDALYHNAKERLRVSGYRDATYLNWRYCLNPLQDFHVLKAMKNKELKGYILYYYDDDVVHIVDVLADNEKRTLQTMCSSLYRDSYKKKIGTVSIKLQGNNPLLPLLENFGFKERNDATSQVIAYADEDEIARLVHDESMWYMTVGDRDI